MTRPDLLSLLLVFAAAALASVLARVHARIVLPTVVVEIVLGILIGREVLDWAEVDGYLTFLSNFGLVFLFFFAGLEVVEQRVPRGAIVRGSAGWAISIGVGLLVGVVLQQAGLDATWWLLGIALSTTSLGTLVPILADSGLLPTRVGVAVLGTGIAGEFWPIVVVSVFLTGAYGAAEEAILLVCFGLVVTLAAVAVLRARPPRLVRVLRETVHTTGPAAVRLAIFVLALLVYIAEEVGFDFVLGAFAAGLVVGLALGTQEGEPVRRRLEGIGFGLLIPIYFVVTGMNFDLDSLLSPEGLALAALFLALLVVVRGASALLWLRGLGPRRTAGLALFGATGLPLIVALAGIGADRGALAADVGASLIGAGMLSVLVLPLLATRIVGRGELDTDGSSTPPDLEY